MHPAGKKEALQNFLLQAELHVIEGENRVACQREIIVRLVQYGSRTERAESLLDLFEDTLELQIARRNRLIRELAELK